MKIRVRKKEQQYAQVHRNLLFNKNLSYKAKGLGSTLEIYSDDFCMSEKTIISKSTDGIRAVKSAILELEKFNFLFRFQTHDDNGQFLTIWIFDSENINVKFILDIWSEYKRKKTVLTTVGTFCVDGTLCVDGQCTPYNNTIYTPVNFTDMDALKILEKMDNNEKKLKQKERNKKSEFYTDVTGKLRKKENLIPHKTTR